MSAYRQAGVDQEAADSLVPLFAKLAARTRRLEVEGDVGGFAGIFSLEGLKDRGYNRPGLVVSTDGVGTKVELLQRAGRHHTAGWDAVAMNADDVVCCGAEPIVFVDYVSVERLDPEVVGEIVKGVADGCTEAGCALVGGETSQHPGLLPPDGYDVVGTCVGVVDLDRVWGPHLVRTGDGIVGISSSGLHSNGFALVRRLLEESGAQAWDDLLEPTAIYARKVLGLRAQGVEVHAAAHVTGGGIVGNLMRALPDGAGAEIEGDRWPRAPVFERVKGLGVTTGEMLRTFNCGLGMLIVTPDAPDVARALSEAGAPSWVVGRVTEFGPVEVKGSF
ncbi:MAG TPA: phosphoribosylformylglycinamidine cyclo-ligase [Actinomycetota bacterium]|nr:phosphoribosylformylglycinamidine cyclo-ligase [Actinomycetota bacterium]